MLLLILLSGMELLRLLISLQLQHGMRDLQISSISKKENKLRNSSRSW